MDKKKFLLIRLLSFLWMAVFVMFSSNLTANKPKENSPQASPSMVENNKPSDIELGIAFGDAFRDEIFMPYIRDLGADVTLIKLRWLEIEPYPPNDPRYVFFTKILDNFLDQLRDGDTALINVFTASDWATDQTCENTTKRKGCPLKDDVTCLAEYGVTCEEAYRNFINKLVTYTDNYLASRNVNVRIKYWQRDTEPALNMHFPYDEPKAYVNLQRYFYESVKSADQRAFVVGICAASGSGKGTENGYIVPYHPDFFRYVIANSKDYFDLMDLRFYHSAYNIPQRLGWFVQEMKRNNYKKPVISTEGGGPTTMEFGKSFNKVLYWCGSRGYTREELYDCLYDMDNLGLLPEEIAIFLPYDPRDKKSVSREKKVERILCRDITQRSLILLENNVEKQWRWEIRAPKGKFCAGPNRDIDVYGDIIFNKLAFLRYPGVICNKNSPIVPQKRKVPYECYKRMQKKLNGIKNVERLSTGNSNIFLYRINKFDRTYIFVVWEKRDIFHGEDQPATPFKFQVDFKAVKVTDVFGNEEIKFSDSGILSLDITDTPLFIEGTKTIKKRR